MRQTGAAPVWHNAGGSVRNERGRWHAYTPISALTAGSRAVAIRVAAAGLSGTRSAKVRMKWTTDRASPFSSAAFTTSRKGEEGGRRGGGAEEGREREGDDEAEGDSGTDCDDDGRRGGEHGGASKGAPTLGYDLPPGTKPADLRRFFRVHLRHRSSLLTVLQLWQKPSVMPAAANASKVPSLGLWPSCIAS